jgi:hypothetical protein
VQAWRRSSFAGAQARRTTPFRASRTASPFEKKKEKKERKKKRKSGRGMGRWGVKNEQMKAQKRRSN